MSNVLSCCGPDKGLWRAGFGPPGRSLETLVYWVS